MCVSAQEPARTTCHTGAARHTTPTPTHLEGDVGGRDGMQRRSRRQQTRQRSSARERRLQQAASGADCCAVRQAGCSLSQVSTLRKAGKPGSCSQVLQRPQVQCEPSAGSSLAVCCGRGCRSRLQAERGLHRVQRPWQQQRCCGTHSACCRARSCTRARPLAHSAPTWPRCISATASQNQVWGVAAGTSVAHATAARPRCPSGRALRAAVAHCCASSHSPCLPAARDSCAHSCRLAAGMADSSAIAARTSWRAPPQRAHAAHVRRVRGCVCVLLRHAKA
jgi:hypothetical protein